MKKKILYALAALALAGGMTVAVALHAEEKGAPNTGLKVEEVFIEENAGANTSGLRHRFEIEIAETPDQQRIGLMHRTEMADDHGMMFLMGKPAREVSFWMKNTLIPLDMLFVDDKGMIANIAYGVPEDLTPIPSGVPVIAVIELNGGTALKKGIKPGDKVHHGYFGTQ